MSSNAVLGFTLTYTAPGGPVSGATASQSLTSIYTPQAEDTMDIPDTTLAGTTYPVSFGTVDAGAVMVIKNKNNQDMGLRVNELSAAGTLVAGTVLLTLANVVGDHLSVELVNANGDAGTVTYHAIRVSNTQVRVATQDSGTYAFVNTSVADVKVHNDGQYAMLVPAGGFLAVGGVLAASSPLKSASLTLTALQAGNATVETFVYGPS